MKQFTIKKIADGIFLVTEPYYREHANIFVIGDKKNCLIIDPGLGFGNLKNFLLECGFNNMRATLTHSHFDHAGGIKHFLPEEIIVTNTLLNNLKSKNFWGLQYLRKKDFMKTAQKKIGSEISSFKISFPLGVSAFEQDIITVKSHSFKIIEAPGHTDDSLILFDPVNKILVTGDTLYQGSLYLDFPNSSKKQFKKSLAFLSSLDFDIVLPGHNKVLLAKEAREIIATAMRSA